MNRRDQVIDLIENFCEAIGNREIHIGDEYDYSVNQITSALDDVLLELEGKHPFEK